MRKNNYALWPIAIKRNTHDFGPREGLVYWKFGMGSRWETACNGTVRTLGWSFFVGPNRFVFGKQSMSRLIAEAKR